MQHTDTIVTTFNEICTFQYRPIFLCCYRILHHTEEAQDTTQLTFLKAWEQLHTYKPDTNMFTWIYTIATRTSIDVLRKRHKLTMVPILEEIAGYAPETFSYIELLADVQEHIQKLSKRQKQVIILACVYDGDTIGISKHLGIHPTTAKTALYHARKNLRKLAS